MNSSYRHSFFNEIYTTGNLVEGERMGGQGFDTTSCCCSFLEYHSKVNDDDKGIVFFPDEERDVCTF